MADNMQEIKALSDAIETSVDNNEVTKAQEVMNDPAKKQQVLDYLKKDEDKVAECIKNNLLDTAVLQVRWELHPDQRNGQTENPYAGAKELYEKMFNVTILVTDGDMTIVPDEDLSAAIVDQQKAADEEFIGPKQETIIEKETEQKAPKNDLESTIRLLSEGLNDNDKQFINTMIESFKAQAKSHFAINKEKASADIAATIDTKMSWMQDLFTNEKELAANMVDMAQASIDTYMDSEKIDALVVGMLYNMIERMHTDIKSKGILENKDATSKWNKEKILYFRNFSHELSENNQESILKSIGMDPKGLRDFMTAMQKGIYSDINLLVATQDNPKKKIKEKNGEMQKGFDNIIASHLSQVADKDPLTSIAKLRLVSGLPVDEQIAQMRGENPTTTMNDVMKQRIKEMNSGMPANAAEQEEAKKVLKLDAVTQKKEKMEKFLSDLGLDKDTMKGLFFKDDGSATMIGILVSGLLSITGNGSFSDLKNIFNGEKKEKSIAEDTNKVVNSYVEAQSKPGYVRKSLKDSWPNETFGIKDEALKAQFLSFDKSLLLTTWQANNINLATYLADYKTANPGNFDEKGILKTDANSAKDFEKFVLQTLAASLEKSHAENTKVALPTDEKSMVNALTTLVQGGKLAEKTPEQKKEQPAIAGTTLLENPASDNA